MLFCRYLTRINKIIYTCGRGHPHFFKVIGESLISREHNFDFEYCLCCWGDLTELITLFVEPINDGLSTQVEKGLYFNVVCSGILFCSVVISLHWNIGVLSTPLNKYGFWLLGISNCVTIFLPKHEIRKNTVTLPIGCPLAVLILKIN